MQGKSTYDRYLEDVSGYARIDAERELVLSDIIQSSENEEQVEAAISELVQSNLLLVLHCLKSFESYLSHHDVRISRMDLIAEGNMALLSSARNFNARYSSGAGDEHDGCIRFSSYACRGIKSRMQRALKHSRFIHVPEHHFSYWSGMQALEEKYGEDLNDQIILDELDISENALQMLKKGMETRTCMLEDMRCSAEDGDESFWADAIPDESVDSPSVEVGRNDLKSFLIDEMESIPARTRCMLSIMYLNERKATLSEVADLYHISSERVRQVTARGLSMLRENIERKVSVSSVLSCA